MERKKKGGAISKTRFYLSLYYDVLKIDKGER